MTGRGTLLAMWALTLFGCPGAGEPPCDQPKPWHRDVDGDGFGGAETQRACAAPDQGWVAEDGDCDDTSAAVFPGAEPSCDGPDDDDCDGVPDLLTADADGDGASTCAGDCDDADATKAPAAAELCNGVDDDCDGLVDLDDGFADPWTCGFCPDPHGELPFEEFTRRRRDVNPCFLDPTISLCRDGVTSVDTLEDGERLHTITWPTMPWGRRPQLLLWLPPGPGTHTDTVQQWGAYAGYRLINLGWPNDNSTDNLCRRRKDLDCFEAVHRERLFGEDASADVVVTPPDSIVGRLTTVLRYLRVAYPEEGWEEFLDGDDQMRWDRVVAGGWSEGGTMSAYLATQVELAGVLLAAPGLDLSHTEDPPFPADWWARGTGATPQDRVWAIYSEFDPQAFPVDAFAPVLAEFGLDSTPYNIDRVDPPYDGSHILTTRELEFDSFNCTTHGAIAVDGCLEEEVVEPAYFHMYCTIPSAP